MSTQICVSTRKLAYLMLEEGFSMEQVKVAAVEIGQPSKGYYPISKVFEYMRSQEQKNAKIKLGRHRN